MSSEPLWMPTMMDPKSYPHPVESVRLVQTHISWVFLAGEYVYKIKKPVNFGFLDFTTLEKRRVFCQEELRLNRRLCPEIYLDSLPITTSDGRVELNGSGETTEWCVRMRRMPEDGMMGGLLAQDAIGGDEIDRIVSRLVPFYQQAASGPEIDKMGSTEVIGHNTEENFEQTLPFVSSLIGKDAYEKICDYTRSFMKDHEDLFLARIREGRICEGHGDLYSANICFDAAKDTVYIFDCIEFNERFRCGDVAADVAFLAMDLDFHGLPVLAKRLLETFAAQTEDSGLLELADFYKCYRAYVRGKIGCFTWAGEGIDEATKAKAKRDADSYFHLATKYAGAAPQAHLYVFFGLSGTGKSTLAEAWARETGAALYNSDRVRKERIAGVPSDKPHLDAFGKGLYAAGITQRTYNALARLAGQHLMRGESVVLDATYQDPEERARILALAQASGSLVHFILCECPEEEIRRRLDARVTQAGRISDGRWEIYLKQKETFHPREGLEGVQVIPIRTDRPTEPLIEEISQAV